MLIIRSLLAVQPIMIVDKRCFELYGYDVIIDENLKPWLLEVNASPSLTANTREDYTMKTEMLHGLLDIVDMEGLLHGDEEHVSGWDLVYDNGYIEIDPNQCNYTSFLGAAVPEPDNILNNIANLNLNSSNGNNNSSNSGGGGSNSGGNNGSGNGSGKVNNSNNRPSSSKVS